MASVTVFDLKSLYFSVLQKVRELDRAFGGCREGRVFETIRFSWGSSKKRGGVLVE